MNEKKLKTIACAKSALREEVLLSLLRERAIIMARLEEIDKKIARERDSAVAASVQPPYALLESALLGRSLRR